MSSLHSEFFARYVNQLFADMVVKGNPGLVQYCMDSVFVRCNGMWDAEWRSAPDIAAPPMLTSAIVPVLHKNDFRTTTCSFLTEVSR